MAHAVAFPTPSHFLVYRYTKDCGYSVVAYNFFPRPSTLNPYSIQVNHEASAPLSQVDFNLGRWRNLDADIGQRHGGSARSINIGGEYDYSKLEGGGTGALVYNVSRYLWLGVAPMLNRDRHGCAYI